MPLVVGWGGLRRAGPQTLALHVDALRGNQEIIVKNAGPQLTRIVGMSGATVLGDGEIVLILNPVALASRSLAQADADSELNSPAGVAATPVQEHAACGFCSCQVTLFAMIFEVWRRLVAVAWELPNCPSHWRYPCCAADSSKCFCPIAWLRTFNSSFTTPLANNCPRGCVLLSTL